MRRKSLPILAVLFTLAALWVSLVAERNEGQHDEWQLASEAQPAHEQEASREQAGEFVPMLRDEPSMDLESTLPANKQTRSAIDAPSKVVRLLPNPFNLTPSRLCISGKVIEASGQPASNVLVLLMNASEMPESDLDSSRLKPSVWPQPVRSSHVLFDGLFWMPWLEPGLYVLCASRNPWSVTELLQIEVVDGMVNPPVTLSLPLGAGLDLVVSGAESLPPGFQFWVVPHAPPVGNEMAFETYWYAFENEKYERARRDPNQWPLIESELPGVWQARDLPPGAIDILVGPPKLEGLTSQGFADSWDGALTRIATVDLIAGQVVTHHVDWGLVALSTLIVEVDSVGDPQIDMLVEVSRDGSLYGAAYTDSSGRALISDLFPGEYSYSARLSPRRKQEFSGVVRGKAHVKLEPGEVAKVQMDLMLVPGLARVMQPDGESTHGMALFVSGPHFFAKRTADADGRIELKMQPGRYQVSWTDDDGLELMNGRELVGTLEWPDFETVTDVMLEWQDVDVMSSGD